ncbi:MAG: hypothetical protein JWR21_894 [Herminiimonas sp.]|nr:hypothetical protein [Herminiimonas sp.]
MRVLLIRCTGEVRTDTRWRGRQQVRYVRRTIARDQFSGLARVEQGY